MIFRFKLVESILTEEDLTDLQKIEQIDASNQLLQSAIKSESDFHKEFGKYLDELTKNGDSDKARQYLSLFKNDNIQLLKEFEDRLLHIIIDNIKTGKHKIIDYPVLDELLFTNAKNKGYFPLTKNSNFFKDNSMSQVMDYFDELIDLDSDGDLFATFYKLIDNKEIPSSSLITLLSDTDRYFGGLNKEEIGQKLKYYKMLATQSSKRRYKIPNELNIDTLMIKGDDGIYRLPSENEQGEIALFALKPNELAYAMREYEKNADEPIISLSDFFNRQKWTDFKTVKQEFIDGNRWLGSNTDKYNKLITELENTYNIDGESAYRKLISNIDIPDKPDITPDEIYNGYLEYSSNSNPEAKESLYYAIRKQYPNVTTVDSSYEIISDIISNSNISNKNDILLNLNTVWENPKAKDNFIKSKIIKDSNGNDDILTTVIDYLGQIKPSSVTGSQILTAFLGKQPQPDDYKNFISQVRDQTIDYLSGGNAMKGSIIKDKPITLTNDGNGIFVDIDNMFNHPINIIGDNAEKQLANYVAGLIKQQLDYADQNNKTRLIV